MSFLVAAAGAAAATAQSFGVQVSALTPLTAQATLGAQTVTNTVPAGPLSSAGGVTSLLVSPSQPLSSVALAIYNWDDTVSSTEATVTLSTRLAAAGPTSPVTASVGPSELLIEFVPTGAPTAVLEVTRQWTGAAGSPVPSVGIDLNNDGTLDLVGAFGSASFPVVPGALVSVRVVVDSAVTAANTNSILSLGFSVRPANDVFVQQVVGQCMNYGPALTIAPAFAGQGVQIESRSVTPFALMVIGFTPVSALLPIPASPLPCILLPNPDLPILLPQFVTQQMAVALPAAVRPASFFVQAIAIDADGTLLGLTPGYAVLGF